MDWSLLPFIGIFVVSLTLLIKASDWFVDSSERIGLSLGISPFVIGVTVVAFGTSLPELASSIIAVINGQSSIVTGNVIGSNVANICLVLGLSAWVAGSGIKTDFAVLDVDYPILLASAIVMWVLAYDGMASRLDGVILVALLGLFLYSSFKSRGPEPGTKVAAGWKAYGLIIVGALGVYFGARYTIESIIQISTALNISTGIIAMSVVAVGTSLPEIIVSISAARRGKASIAVGNVVGSNIFNVFGVMGIPAIIGGVEMPASETGLSLGYMIGVTVLLGFLIASNNISRYEGMLLVGLYAIFLLQLF